MQARSAFDIAVAGFGARRRDTEDYELAGRGGVPKRSAKYGAISCDVCDIGVGRKDCHQGVAMFVGEVNCGEGDGRGSVAAGGLDENVRSGDAGNLAACRSGLSGISYDPTMAFGKNRDEARDGFAQHGLTARNVQELLGRMSAAARPEACSAASGQENGASGK